MFRAFIAAFALFISNAALAAAQPTDADVGWETMLCSDNSNPAFTGYCMGPATRLEITIFAFQLRRSSDQQMVTIASGAQTFNFASVSANTEIGQFASSLQIPYGTYDALGFQMGLNTVLAGQTNGGAAGDCALTQSGFTTSLASAEPRNLDFRAMGLDYDTESQVISGDRMQGIDNEATGLPLTVRAGSRVSFNMSVSAGRGIWYQYAGGVCIGAGPYGPRVRTGFTVS